MFNFEEMDKLAHLDEENKNEEPVFDEFRPQGIKIEEYSDENDESYSKKASP